MTTKILKGKEIAAPKKEKIKERLEQFSEQPNLTIVRVGNDADQIYYENSCKKILGNLGFDVKTVILPEDVAQEVFDSNFTKVNDDPDVHGILLLKPLPAHLSDHYASQIIKAEKDVDCFGEKNMLSIYKGDFSKFIPCTAQACLDILDFTGVELSGSRVVMVGYSMVVGKPLALALMDRGAVVKICRSTTKDLKRETRDAEIVISAIGIPHHISADQLDKNAIVIDVGINVTPEGKVVGDVAYETAVKKVAAITPVPGGVGTVTNTVLAGNVLKAYELLKGKTKENRNS